MQPDAIYITLERGGAGNKQREALGSSRDAEFKGRTFLLDTKAGENKAEVIVWAGRSKGYVGAGQIGINCFAISKTNKLVIIVICITERTTFTSRLISGVIQCGLTK